MEVSEDAIINTQESVVSVKAIDDQNGKLQDLVKSDANINLKMKKQTEVRRSERLIGDIAVTTKEKNERMAKKRNLEGNSFNTNMFSELPVELLNACLLRWELQ